MRIFVEVAERGSFALAAHALRLSAATVSEQLANLEKHVGASLINRSTRNMALTDEGAEYYALAKRVLADIGEVEARLGGAGRQPSGRLHIDVVDAFASRLILPVLAEFAGRYPAIDFDFSHSGHQFDGDQTGADLMIRTPVASFQDSRLVVRPLGYARTVCLAAPAYLERHGEPATPQELLQHSCIGFIDPWSGRHWEWFFERSGERFSVDVPQRFAWSSGQARLDAALRGLGIVNELDFGLAPLLQSGQLRSILEDWSWTPPPIHVLYPQNRRGSRKVQAFVDFLLEKYPSGRELDPPE